MNISAINTLPQDERVEAMKEASQKRRKYFVCKHRLSNGDMRDVEIYTSPVELGDQAYLYSLVHDITERKQAEVQIKTSLAEKEVLLKEIHHRVKNNMQVISSLLRMQSGFLKNDDDKRMFHESQQRIQSMSLVYNKLYQSENLASISFKEYVKDLAGGL